jgi:hypothetical protein
MIGMETVLNFRGSPNFNGFFNSLEVPEEFVSAAKFDPRDPFAPTFAPIDAREPRRVIGATLLVSSILQVRDIAQIIDAVVVGVTVNMIDLV